MSRLYWLHNAALGGILVGLLLLAPLAPQAQTIGAPPGGQESTPETAAEPPNARWPVPYPTALQDSFDRIARAIEAIGAKDDPPEKTEREESDLQAQWAMAKWAKYMLIATVASVVLGLVGVVFIWRTLHHTRRTANAAIRAVAAARISNRYIREANRGDTVASQRELRAYLSVYPDGITQRIHQHDAIGLVSVKNVGKLPAHNVVVQVRLAVSDIRKADFPVLPDPQDVTRVIQPGADLMQGSQDTFSQTDVWAHEHGYAFVWGIVYYDDGFGERRFTRFCHRYAIEARLHGHSLNAIASQTVLFIDTLKARYHEIGNDAD